MDLYERYHAHRKLQKRVISAKNFTHHHLIEVVEPYLHKTKNVLDIGCGTGTVAFYLAEKGIRVVGLDISRNAVEIARENAKCLGLSDRVKFKVSNFPKSYISGKFDLVICSEVLEHIEDDSKSVSKILRLLGQGGMAIFSSPLKESVLNRLGFTKHFDKDVGHLRRYDAKQFTAMITKNDFKVIKVRKVQGLFRDLLFTFTAGSLIIRLANRFDILSSTLSFFDNLLLPLGAADVIVLARK